ncbi:ParA family partition ATPase [Halochromatium salexigens]|uniref:Peptide transporter n=1 Tax=Halochromatium salexigens TaxID=49447 RepID=A0AAJ0UES0_HALSE|nr:ParA family partition ATPase [Halochromatium salexigens]MBK5930114.1 peptide transporter [Halochromatium salexigens]
MANVISVLNPKGGAGKTTLAIHLARALHLDNNKVLLVDSDRQGSARDWNEAGDGRSGFPVVGLDRPTIEKELVSLAEGYDWVVIDGAAKLEKMIASAVKASDLVLIPVQPSPLDIWACDSLVEMIQARQQVTDGIPSAAFVVSRAKKGTVLAREVADAVRDYEFPILHGSIHDRTIFAKSMIDGATVLDDEPEGAAAFEIRHLLKQIMEAFA